jgi:hypothetical protein
MQLPRWLCVRHKDGLGAGGHAIGAKRALATPKINFRISGCTANDDALGTSCDAFAASSAAFDKYGLVDCSGRTYGSGGRYGQTSKQIASTDVDCVGHFESGSRWTNQHLK